MNHKEPRRSLAGAGKRTVMPFRRAGLWLAVIASVTLYTQSANAGHFDPPDMEGFSLHSERDADGDGDGTNETHIMQYMNTQGDSLFSMTTEGRIWAWSLDSHDSDIGSSNYVIRDSDCDGVFDEVYSLDEQFHVPACLKQP